MLRISEAAAEGGLIPLIKCVLHSPDGDETLLVNVILDTASTKSFLTSQCCRLMNITGTCPRTEVFAGFYGQMTPVETSVAAVTLSDYPSMLHKVHLPNIHIVKKISAHLPAVSKQLSDKLNQTLKVDVDWHRPQTVDMLLGIGHPKRHRAP